MRIIKRIVLPDSTFTRIYIQCGKTLNKGNKYCVN